ncbi:MAG: sugar ABC transporter substrate-binding protein [Lachnospiraceae bacterium]|nr:sugar ABC transporter substrate-binding protein [Lachnospiraceae bacterium]
MKKKMVMALAMVLGLQLAVSGIANAEESDVTFATIMQTNNDWAMTLAKGGEEACEKYGYKHITMNPEGDIQKQTDLVQSCISQGVTGLFLHAVDSQAIIPVLKQAADAGIYVFAQSDMAEAFKDYDNCFFADYNHKTAASKCADAVAEALGNEGKVGIIAGIAGADNTTQRSEGFRKRIEEEYSDIEIVNEINCDWDRAVAMSAAEDMITGNPDIGAFYCMGEEMAWGVLEAVQDSGKDIKVVTIDASTPTVQMVMDGEMYACIGCPPKSFSGGAIDIMNKLLAGETVDSQLYPVEPTYMTQENASLEMADY